MSSPLPIDVSGIDEPLPDLGHEAIRVAALNAIQAVWTNHLGLLEQLNAAQAQLVATQATVADQGAQLTNQAQQIADLTARVDALQPPTPTGV